MLPRTLHNLALLCLLASAASISLATEPTGTAAHYLVAVSNERAGTVTLIDGNAAATSGTAAVAAAIPVGKRPRGTRISPDGRLLYVAVSGSPIQGPPALDAQGNPTRLTTKRTT